MTNQPKSSIKPKKLIAVKVDEKKKIIPKGNPRKAKYWRVTLGKRITGTKKQRRFFKTEKDANQFIGQALLASHAKGQSAFTISPALAIEAMELQKELEPHNVSLTTAVHFYLKQAPAATSKTVEQLIPDYLLTKSNLDYRKAQAIALNVFACDFGKKRIGAIFPPELSKWFAAKNWEPLNARNYMRDISMFFKWAKQLDYVPSNPMDKISRPKVKKENPGIFTVDEAKNLLETAKAHPELGLFPMYALGLLAGIRVQELERMTWEMCHWSEGEIRISTEVGKFRKPRNIPIGQQVRDWLQNFQPQEGQIVDSKNLRKRREKLLKLAGVTNQKNGLRHTFASYHAAKHRNPGDLQMILGQETPNVLFRHYISTVKRFDADAYFALRSS